MKGNIPTDFYPVNYFRLRIKAHKAMLFDRFPMEDIVFQKNLSIEDIHEKVLWWCGAGAQNSLH
jgi:hypothetical protein